MDINDNINERQSTRVKEYQQKALRTLATENERDTLMMCALGVAGEVGEVNDILKKHLFHRHNKPLDKDKLILELGDLLWYISIAASTQEMSLDNLMEYAYAETFVKGAKLEYLACFMAKYAGQLTSLVVTYDQFPPYQGDEKAILGNTTKRFREFLDEDLCLLLTQIANFAFQLDTTINDIMTRNIAKLEARHGVNGEQTGFTSRYASDSGSSL